MATTAAGSQQVSPPAAQGVSSGAATVVPGPAGAPAADGAADGSKGTKAAPGGNSSWKSNSNQAQGTLRRIIQCLQIDPVDRTETDIGYVAKWLMKKAPSLKFFASKPPSMMREFARHMYARAYPPHAVVFKQGDIGDLVYIIVEGSVGVYLKATKEEEDERQAAQAELQKAKIAAAAHAAPEPEPEDGGEGSAKDKEPEAKQAVKLKTAVAVIVASNMLRRGSAVHKEDLREVCVLNVGDRFGELALQSDKVGRRAATVMTKQRAVFFTLDKLTYRQLKTEESTTADMTDYMQFLQTIPCLSGMDRDQLVRLTYNLKEKQVHRGAILVKEGDLECPLQFLRRGACRVERGKPDGPTVTLELLGEGAVFGEGPAVYFQASTVSIIADSVSTVLSISSADFGPFKKLTAAAMKAKFTLQQTMWDDHMQRNLAANRLNRDLHVMKVQPTHARLPLGRVHSMQHASGAPTGPGAPDQSAPTGHRAYQAGVPPTAQGPQPTAAWMAAGSSARPSTATSRDGLSGAKAPLAKLGSADADKWAELRKLASGLSDEGEIIRRRYSTAVMAPNSRRGTGVGPALASPGRVRPQSASSCFVRGDGVTRSDGPETDDLMVSPIPALAPALAAALVPAPTPAVAVKCLNDYHSCVETPRSAGPLPITSITPTPIRSLPLSRPVSAPAHRPRTAGASAAVAGPSRGSISSMDGQTEDGTSRSTVLQRRNTTAGVVVSPSSRSIGGVPAVRMESLMGSTRTLLAKRPTTYDWKSEVGKREPFLPQTAAEALQARLDAQPLRRAALTRARPK